MQETVIPIGGMSCQGCVRSATQALTQIDGVAAATVSLETGTAHVSFDPTRTNEAALRAAITQAGFVAA